LTDNTETNRYEQSPVLAWVAVTENEIYVVSSNGLCAITHNEVLFS
jgi:hypothetical protein